MVKIIYKTFVKHNKMKKHRNMVIIRTLRCYDVLCPEQICKTFVKHKLTN